MSLILSGTDGLSDVDGTAATPAIRGTDANTGIFFPAADTIAFSEGGAEAARIDSAGNFGLGVTPSAWQVNNRAIQLLEGYASISSNNSQGCCDVAFNCFNAGSAATSGWKYTNTGVAVSLFQQQAGAFKFLTAASGTAGNTITFTQAMTLDASGNLGIGNTSPSSRLHVTATASTIGQSRIEGSGVGALFSGMTAGSIGFLHSNTGTLAFGTSTSDNNLVERARIDSSGNLLVGTTSAGDGKVRISASANAFNLLKMDDTGSTGGNYIQFLNSAGNQAGSINHNGTATVNYGSGSDYRLKENVQRMVGALETVAQLKPCTYIWKADGSAGQGFIAHELQTIIPDAVVGEKDAVNEDGSIKTQTVDTSFLVATLTAAIQEQQALITQLTARITALEGA